MTLQVQTQVTDVTDMSVSTETLRRVRGQSGDGSGDQLHDVTAFASQGAPGVEEDTVSGESYADDFDSDSPHTSYQQSPEVHRGPPEVGGAIQELRLSPLPPVSAIPIAFGGVAIADAQ